MESSIESLRPYVTRITVTIPAEDVQTALSPLVEKYNKKGTVKGFRPGKAPASQIIAKFGQAILSEVFDGLITKSVLKAIEDSKVYALGVPTVEEQSGLKMGQPLVVKAVFYARHDVDLPDFSGLSLIIADPEPGEAAMRAALDDYRRRLATITEAEPGYEIKAGDLVCFSTLYPHEGRYIPVRHLGRQPGPEISEEELLREDDSDLQTLEAGLPDPDSKISMEMVGRKVGDFIDLPLHVRPHSETGEPLAEKELIGRLAIRKVSVVSLPDLDDDLVQTLSIPDVDNVEQFTDFVRKTVRSRREGLAENIVQSQIINFIDKSVDLTDLPKPILEAEIDSQMLNNKPLDRDSMKKTNDEWLEENRSQRGEFRDLALKSVKTAFVTEQIVLAQSLEPSEAEVVAKVARLLAYQPRSLREDPKILESYRGTAKSLLIRELAFGWIEERAQKTLLPFEEAIDRFRDSEAIIVADSMDQMADDEGYLEETDPLYAIASETIKLTAQSEEEAAESLKAERDKLRAERKAKEEAIG
jgi:trigger factor